MYEGLWIVQFAGMEGKDAGVVVLTKGKVLGGDNAFTYVGTYEVIRGGISAVVVVQNFNPAVGNVLGISGDFTLSFKAGEVNAGILQGDGTTTAAPGFGLKVKLTRRAELN